MKQIEQPTIARMIGTAIAIDAAQGVLTASYIGVLFSPVLSAGAAYVFWKWFKRYEGKAPDPRNNPWLFTMLAEFIPALNTLPLWTITITLGILRHNRARGGL